MSVTYNCGHAFGTDGSTFDLLRYSGKENGVHDLWCIVCRNCGARTELCLEIKKAKAMAAKEQFVENAKRKPISRYFHGV